MESDVIAIEHHEDVSDPDVVVPQAKSDDCRDLLPQFEGLKIQIPQLHTKSLRVAGLAWAVWHAGNLTCSGRKNPSAHPNRGVQTHAVEFSWLMCPSRNCEKMSRMPYWFDGNNLIGLSAAAARLESAIRRAFLERLSYFSRIRGGRFVVFFDGDDPDGSAPPGRLQVRYSAPLSTDEAILHRLREARNPAEVIVVTNDRSLTWRCRECGAKSLDWKQFLSKMRTNLPSAQGTALREEDNVNIDEWVNYFGLDKKTLK